MQLGWSIKAAGECRDRRAERSLLLRLALALTGEGVSVDGARMTTRYHGLVDLADLCDLVGDKGDWEDEPPTVVMT